VTATAECNDELHFDRQTPCGWEEIASPSTSAFTAAFIEPGTLAEIDPTNASAEHETAPTSLGTKLKGKLSNSFTLVRDFLTRG
jgi:hypothetical protein